jgi:hypothetical protein
MDAFTEQERAKIQKFVSDAVNGRETKARPAASARRRRAPSTPLEKKADAWASWFYKRMAESNSRDPAEHLPDALAELEQKLGDTIRAELAHAQKKIRELERIAKTGTIVVCWKTDAAAFKATPVMSDGTDGAVLDVRPFLQQFSTKWGANHERRAKPSQIARASRSFRERLEHTHAARKM